MGILQHILNYLDEQHNYPNISNMNKNYKLNIYHQIYLNIFHKYSFLYLGNTPKDKRKHIFKFQNHKIYRNILIFIIHIILHIAYNFLYKLNIHFCLYIFNKSLAHILHISLFHFLKLNNILKKYIIF